jgi:hypothetical protein
VRIPRAETEPSIRRQLFFWWILFVVFQSAERLFLLKGAVEAESPDGIAPTEPAVVQRFYDLMAHYQISNSMLDQNRIWSGKEFGHRL